MSDRYILTKNGTVVFDSGAQTPPTPNGASNNLIANAEDITDITGDFIRSNVGATMEANEPSKDLITPQHSIWFKITPKENNYYGLRAISEPSGVRSVGVAAFEVYNPDLPVSFTTNGLQVRSQDSSPRHLGYDAPVEAVMMMHSGITYYIGVDSDEVGDIKLTRL